MELRHLTDEEIQNYLDGNLSPENKFAQRHLKRCKLCQKTLKEYKSLYLELKDEKGFRLSRGFASSVISKLPKEPVARSQSKYAEILLVIVGIVAAGFTTLHFVDVKPLVRMITQILLPQFEFISASFGSIANLLEGLNINSSLLVFSGLTLLIIRVLDYIILHLRRTPISNLR